MTLGVAERQPLLLDDVDRFCDEALAEGSIYVLLHREREGLFPDEMFADLFSERGRRSVPPSVLATVMVLQRLEGLSDREAVERYTFDSRWRYATGVGSYGSGGWASFSHTVLVDMRARLATSQDPKRIFRVSKEAAAEAGLVGTKRVLDSTPLYDAVATMDTITLIRSAVRGLLRVADGELEGLLRSKLTSGDDYASASKPQIDWDDEEARAELIDSRARDAMACLAVLENRELTEEVHDAMDLLATVLGQDLDETEDGRFRIARRVAKDRVISTVDPEARHGHKTAARGFDGYKGHVAVDPDSEIITDTEVTAGNAGDASVAADLIDDLLDEQPQPDAGGPDASGPDASEPDAGEPDAGGPDASEPDASGSDGAEFTGDADKRRGAGLTSKPRQTKRSPRANNAKKKQTKKSAAVGRQRRAEARRAKTARRAESRTTSTPKPRPVVYGDAAYGAGAFLDHLAGHSIESRCKTQPPTAAGDRFTKARFVIDLEADTVTCPNEVTATIRRNSHGDGVASFKDACAQCPLRDQCTNAQGGRTIQVGRYEHRLAEAREQQQDPNWADDYRATRPKVERKLGQLVRRKHGGRHARMRGRAKIDADFSLLAAAHNLANLARRGLHSTPTGFATTAC